MRYLKWIIVAIFISTLSISSCNDRNIARFNINNNSDFQLDSVRVSLQGHDNASFYISLKPGQTKTLLLDMNNLPMSDGSYLLSYKNPLAESGTQTFGYYTNGSPVEEITNITIFNDTITFEHSFNKYSYRD